MGKTLKYFKKRHRLLSLLSFIYGGYGTFWVLIDSGIPFYAKIIAGVLYGLLVIFGIKSLITFIPKRINSGVDDIIRIDTKNLSSYPIKIKDTDPAKALPIADNYEEIIKNISKKSSVIRIIAYHGENVLPAIKEKIKEVISNNVEVRLLITKKESIFVNEVWELENKKEPDKQVYIRELIKEIRNESGKNAFYFKCKEYNTQARYALIAIDNNWAWWTPYHPGKRVEKTTSFILTNDGKESVIHECISHFDCLWNQIKEEI